MGYSKEMQHKKILFAIIHTGSFFKYDLQDNHWVRHSSMDKIDAHEFKKKSIMKGKHLKNL